MEHLQVKKQSGDFASFSKERLIKSLLNSGANKDDAEKVYNIIEKSLYNGIPTKDLYEKAFATLKNIKSSIAAKYSLKRALQKLGPDGFYFEKWVAKIFETQGYQAITGQTLEGKSTVTHEVDVVATNKKDFLICECKFRNDIDAKISVTTPMYFLARFEDLKDKKFSFFNNNFVATKGFLITNAFFTSDSINFSNYYHINLISWNYPENNSLKKITDDYALYPITCLTCLPEENIKEILDKECILVSQLAQNPTVLNALNLDQNHKKEIIKEALEMIEGIISK